MAETMEALSWTETSDGDSGYSEEMLSTRSITSSIYEHEKENGRSYHAFHAGKYVMPNDEGEQDRMDSQSDWLMDTIVAETDIYSSTLPRPAADAREQPLACPNRKPFSCSRRRHRDRHLGNGLRR